MQRERRVTPLTNTPQHCHTPQPLFPPTKHARNPLRTSVWMDGVPELLQLEVHRVKDGAAQMEPGAEGQKETQLVTPDTFHPPKSPLKAEAE